MKTLFIITSIILLSFQIDRLLVGHLSGSSDNIEMMSRFLTKSEPDPAKFNKQPDSGVTFMKPENTLRTALVKKAGNTEKHSGVKLRAGLRNTTLKNSQLHQSLKASGSFLEMATLLFGFDQHKNTDTKSFNAIMRIADRLIFNDSLKISIAGFTDNAGDVNYNNTLSLLRAQNIKQYLLDLGVNAKQIIVSANGIAYPVADNSTSTGRAANRRVEMMLIK